MAPSGVLGAIVALAAAFPVAAAAATAGIQEQLSDIAAEYDYIVVGGGTSGLVVANRLSADPNSTTLLIAVAALGQADLVGIQPPCSS